MAYFTAILIILSAALPAIIFYIPFENTASTFINKASSVQYSIITTKKNESDDFIIPFTKHTSFIMFHEGEILGQYGEIMGEDVTIKIEQTNLFDITNEYTAYFTASFERNDYIEFLSNFFPAYLFFGLDSCKMYASITYLNLTTLSNQSAIVELGNVNVDKWVTGFISIKNYANSTYVSAGILEGSSQIVTQLVYNGSLFTLNRGYFLYLAYVVNSKLKLQSVILENQYVTPSKIKMYCVVSGECISLNTDFCIVSASSFYTLNITSTTQCKCHSLCGSCSGTSLNCIECNQNIVNINTVVLPTQQPTCSCLSHYYFNAISATCDQCSPYCLECSGPGNTLCSSCALISNMAPINGTSCFCQAHHYYDSILNICESCHPLCIECEGNSNSQCLSCSNLTGAVDRLNKTCECNSELNFIYSENLCICKPSSYLNPTENKCVECHWLCDGCFGIEQSNCLSCNSDPNVMSIDNSACQCIYQHFYSSTQKQCIKCFVLCQECWDSQSSTCLLCISDPNVDANLPTCHCKSQYYFNTTSNICAPCHPFCNECAGESYSECISCSTEIGLTELCQCDENKNFIYSEEAKKCLCKSHYFLNSSNECEICHSLCLECENSSSNSSCISCQDLPNVIQSQNICDCELFCFYNNSGCHQCHSLCKVCTGPGNDSCLECFQEYGIVYRNTNICDCDTHKGYNSLTKKCVDCHSLCKSCFDTSNTTCFDCLPTVGAIYLHQFTCICSPHTFYNEITKKCEECFSLCTECIGNQNGQCIISCNELAHSSPLENGACYCQHGYIYSPTLMECESLKCDSLCANCVNSSSCLECKSDDGIIKENDKCYCKEGYYYNEEYRNCSKCFYLCKSCRGPSNANCSKCLNDLIIVSGIGCQCSFQYYLNNDIIMCAPCHYLCNGCIGPTNLNCTNGCLNGLSKIEGNLVQCFCESLKQYIGVTKCEPCHSLCMECDGPLNSNCKGGCSNGGVLLNSECVCLSHYYLELKNGSCLICHSLCKECIGPLNSDCLGNCRNGGILENDGECVCPSHYYLEINNDSCLTCFHICNECTGPLSTDCVGGCTNGGALVNNECACLSHFYLNTNTSSCSECHQLCKECNGPLSSDCIGECANGSVLVNGKCVCPSHYYFNLNFCFICHPLCKECEGELDSDCIGDCVNGGILQENKCVCPTHYYLDEQNGKCSGCYTLCNECDGPSNTDCLGGCANRGEWKENKCICPPHYHLNNKYNGSWGYACVGECINGNLSDNLECICPSQYYLDLQNSECLKCHPLCKNCNGSLNSDCLGEGDCLNGGVFINHQCICPSQHYLDQQIGKCMKCHYLCQNCSGPTRYDCIDGCTTNYTLMNSTCRCNDEEYIGLTKCESCSSKLCAVCDSSPLKCDACKYGISVINKDCAIPSNYYIDFQNKMVSSCHHYCSICDGPAENKCSQCNYNLILQNETCQCESGKYFNSTFKSCLECAELCLACTGPTSHECIACKGGITISQSICECFPYSHYDTILAKCVCQGNLIYRESSICDCQESWVFNSTLIICEQCDILCQKCKTKFFCEKCKDEEMMKIVDGICICKENYYNTLEGKCMKCHEACNECTGPLNSDCIECNIKIDKVDIYRIDYNTCDVGFGYYLSLNSNKAKKVPCKSLMQSNISINLEEMRLNNKLGCICSAHEFYNGEYCEKCGFNCNSCSKNGCHFPKRFSLTSIIVLTSVVTIAICMVIIIYKILRNRIPQVNRNRPKQAEENIDDKASSDMQSNCNARPSLKELC